MPPRKNCLLKPLHPRSTEIGAGDLEKNVRSVVSSVKLFLEDFMRWRYNNVKNTVCRFLSQALVQCWFE